MNSNAAEILEFERLERHLLSKFSPPLRPEAVRRCIWSCAAMFESAPIRRYITLLVERAAEAHLSAELRAIEAGAEVEAPTFQTDRVDSRPMAHT